MLHDLVVIGCYFGFLSYAVHELLQCINCGVELLSSKSTPASSCHAYFDSMCRSDFQSYGLRSIVLDKLRCRTHSAKVHTEGSYPNC